MHPIIRIFLCTLFVGATQTVQAQSDPIHVQQNNWIELTTATTSPGVANSISLGRLRAGYLVTPLIGVQIDVPFSDAGQGFPFQGSNIGNVYIGLLVNTRQSGVFSEIGIRFPTAGSNASDPLAFRSVAPEYGEAFLDNVTSLSGNVNLVAKSASGGFVKLRTGIAAWLDDLGRVGSETLLNYSAEVGFAPDGFRADAGIQGRAFLSAGQGSFADRTFHQFRTAIRTHLGSFTPTATLTIPLGEFNDGVDYVIGLGVGIKLGGTVGPRDGGTGAFPLP